MRTVFIAIITIAAATLGGALSSSPRAQPLPPAPPITVPVDFVTWQPNSASLIVSPGDATSTKVYFTPKLVPFALVQAIFSPELQPYATASPSSFTLSLPGQPQTIDLDISVPQGAPPQTINGFLRLAQQPLTTPFYESQLPITIQIWTRFRSLDSAIATTFAYPPNWQLDEVSDPELTGVQITSPDNSALAIIPLGGLPYDIAGEDTSEIDSSLTIDGFTALRRDFVVDSTLVLSRIEFADVPGRPDFRIDLRPQSDQDRDTLEKVLKTVQIAH